MCIATTAYLRKCYIWGMKSEASRGLWKGVHLVSTPWITGSLLGFEPRWQVSVMEWVVRNRKWEVSVVQSSVRNGKWMKYEKWAVRDGKRNTRNAKRERKMGNKEREMRSGKQKMWMSFWATIVFISPLCYVNPGYRGKWFPPPPKDHSGSYRGWQLHQH